MKRHGRYCVGGIIYVGEGVGGGVGEGVGVGG